MTDHRIARLENGQEELRKIVEPLREEVVRLTAATQANTRARDEDREAWRDLAGELRWIRERYYRLLIAVAIVAAALAAVFGRGVPGVLG